MSDNLSNAQRQPSEEEDEDEVPSLRHHLRANTENTIDVNLHPWRKRNILSLDGGGIRGYWSLLVLEKLMEAIAILEEQSDQPALHSFDPISRPRNVSQVPLTREEHQHIQALYRGYDEDDLRREPGNRRYLPCHYFDLIGGTSTGALIAIMLGRFRMTVPDCLAEYSVLGQEVFGNPRRFPMLRVAVDKPRLRSSPLKKIFIDVARNRNEKPWENTSARIKFPARPNVCQTFVTTLMSRDNDAANEAPYLIRSYDYEPPHSPYPSRGPTPGTTFNQSRASTGQSRTNTGFSTNSTTRQAQGVRTTQRLPKMTKKGAEKAHDYDIWQVARAATAATTYFKPLVIHNPQGHKMTYTDGGLDLNNNPIKGAKNEIIDLYKEESIDIVVSVGTARKVKDANEKKPFYKAILRLTRDLGDKVTNPEKHHDDIVEELGDDPIFSYYRLNDPGGLNVDLDEWKPKKNMFNKVGGSKTITEIRRAFGVWFGQWTVSESFRRCAEQLVERRQRRSHTPEWERYATGCEIRCKREDCDTDLINSENYKEHLRLQHSFEPRDLEPELRRRRRQWRYPDPQPQG